MKNKIIVKGELLEQLNAAGIVVCAYIDTNGNEVSCIDFENKDQYLSLLSPAEKLQLVKDYKILEMKLKRDESNILPITNKQASVIDPVTKSITGQSYFYFYTKRHPSNPASDPNAILAAVRARKDPQTPNSPIPYATKDLNNNPIIVLINENLAVELTDEITIINNLNYGKFNILEKTINACQTIESVEAITWS